jgi:TolB protein
MRTMAASLAALIAAAAALAPAAEPIRLTDDGKLKFAPAFIDAEHLAFAVHAVPRQVVIVRLNLADGTQEPLHAGIAAHQFDPAWSADGRLHAFVMSATSPQMVLVIQDRQTGAEFQYRPREARATARSPAIAPDGSRIAFSLSDVEGHRIASVDARGEDLRLLTDAAGTNLAPAWSPDGRQIAFSSSRDGDFDLYVMDADGGNLRRIVASPGLDTRPAWSPDGARLAFTSNRDGNYEIYCCQVDGTQTERVTDNLGKDDYAAWHPDGRRLAMVAELEGKSDVLLLDAGEAATAAR